MNNFQERATLLAWLEDRWAEADRRYTEAVRQPDRTAAFHERLAYNKMREFVESQEALPEMRSFPVEPGGE